MFYIELVYNENNSLLTSTEDLINNLSEMLVVVDVTFHISVGLGRLDRPALNEPPPPTCHINVSSGLTFPR
jgi:hypothetical protein